MSRSHKTLTFWRTKTLEQMSKAEWESLLRRLWPLGTLNKLEDIDTGDTHFTAMSAVSCSTTKAAAAATTPTARPRCRTASSSRRAACAASSGCRRPALIAWWRKDAICTGGTRWCREIRKRCTPPASRWCATVSPRARPTCRTEQLEDYIVSWPGKVPKGTKKRAASMRK